MLLPLQSIATITNKSSTSNFLIASAPNSSYAITSDFFIELDIYAPAPPIAARYAHLFFS